MFSAHVLVSVPDVVKTAAAYSTVATIRSRHPNFALDYTQGSMPASERDEYDKAAWYILMSTLEEV